MSARRAELVREVCATVDTAVTARALVIGSPPPSGTDLDLLVRRPEDATLRKALRDAGLAEKGRRLVRFGLGAAFEVELQVAEEWGLPEAELEALYAEAKPLPGFRRLVEPAPHHRLLILATRLLGSGEGLSDRRRARIDRALAGDPDAWRAAAARLPLWGSASALDHLRAAHRGDRRDRGGWWLRLLRRLRSLARPRRRGAVVALSGVDGSGKSSQAKLLRDALRDLGLQVEVEWIPLASNAWIARLGATMKRPLTLLRSFRPAPPEPGEDVRGLAPNPGSILRERSRTANYGWASLVAAANGASHAYRVARHRAGGRVVVFDRYTLDSMARLRFFYGEERALRLPRALIEMLSPRPAVGFFLDVSADTSAERKDDMWHIEELERQVRLYREEHERARVVRLDGERPPAELAAEIAAAVWRRLH